MKLGLTGGIGCGKSTAAKMLEANGWRRLDSDALVGELFAGDGAVRAALAGRWGEAVLTPEGVDRARIAQTVFADEAELRWLEGLLHPRVRERWQGALAADPEALWVVEIPLLFEKNLEKHFDFTVCVSVSEAVQQERLAARGLAPEQVRARIARQLPLAEKRHRADFVLSNTGTLAYLQSQIDALHARLSPAPSV